METLITILKTDPNTANAFAALASAIAALIALFVSVISLFVSRSALNIQRKHNVLSLRPLPEVTVADYENSLRVKIRNNGSGPMIIQYIKIDDSKNEKESLIEWMPNLPNNRTWNAFSHSLKQRTLLAGHEIKLLELTEFEGEKYFSECRALVRNALSCLNVHVSYTDVYGTNFPIHTKKLDWFGRHKKNKN
jgi:hypothetical protein